MIQTTDIAYVADRLKRLHELRALIVEAAAEERKLTEWVKDYMADEDVTELDIEGAPPVWLKSRATGRKWDTSAIAKLMENPHEFQRLVELGAVTLSATVINTALQKGNLARVPPGSVNGRTEYLSFKE